MKWHGQILRFDKFFQKSDLTNIWAAHDIFSRKTNSELSWIFLDKKETLLARRICNYIKNLWNGMFKSCLYKRRFSLTCGSLGLFWFYFGQCTNNGQCSAVNNCVHIVVHTSLVHTQPKQVDWPSIAIEFHPPTFWQVFQKSKLPYNIWVAAHHMLFSRFFKPIWTSLVSLFVIIF